jgi:hypothetical protein
MYIKGKYTKNLLKEYNNRKANIHLTPILSLLIKIYINKKKQKILTGSNENKKQMNPYCLLIVLELYL